MRAREVTGDRCDREDDVRATSARTVARARAARARVRARARARGFTLIELMVVVILVSILAMLATPAMRTQRDDTLQFDYARRVQLMLNRTRARAAGRGAAHLFVAQPSGLNRGRFALFEALDGSAIPVPRQSCKTPNQWNDAAAFVPGVMSNTARIVEGLELNAPGANVDADIRSAFTVNNVGQQVVVMCVAPSGAVFVGSGASVGGAVTNMQAQLLPFDQQFDITITRNVGGVPVGLRRRVIQPGSAAARLQAR